MEIQIQFARGEVLKEIKADGEPVHTVTLTPRFMTNHMRPAIAYVTVKGKSGREVSAVIRVDPATGKIKAVSCDRERQPLFDADAPPAVPALPAAPPAVDAAQPVDPPALTSQPSMVPPFREPKRGGK